jgi:hypothetical protein
MSRPDIQPKRNPWKIDSEETRKTREILAAFIKRELTSQNPDAVKQAEQAQQMLADKITAPYVLTNDRVYLDIAAGDGSLQYPLEFGPGTVRPDTLRNIQDLANYQETAIFSKFNGVLYKSVPNQGCFVKENDNWRPFDLENK